MHFRLLQFFSVFRIGHRPSKMTKALTSGLPKKCHLEGKTGASLPCSKLKSDIIYELHLNSGIMAISVANFFTLTGTKLLIIAWLTTAIELSIQLSTSGVYLANHCDPEPDSEKLKCLHHFYTDKYDSNAKNCHYY